MNRGHGERAAVKSAAITQLQAVLRDELALLAKPGAHHKALLTQAYALHQDQVIDGDELNDLLELADSALAFAVESLLDINSNE